MAILLDTKIKGVAELTKLMGEGSAKLPNELRIAINSTAKKHVKALGKPKGPIRSKLAVSSKGVKETLSQPRKATKSSLSATVRVKKKSRPPLKEFGAKQTKKGVSYRIYKGGKRGLLKGAFISDKLGGHAFLRRTKKRLKISKRLGTSVWSLYVKDNVFEIFSEPEIRKELEKQIGRRLQFQIFKTKKALGWL